MEFRAIQNLFIMYLVLSTTLPITPPGSDQLLNISNANEDSKLFRDVQLSDLDLSYKTTLEHEQNIQVDSMKAIPSNLTEYMENYFLGEDINPADILQVDDDLWFTGNGQSWIGKLSLVNDSIELHTLPNHITPLMLEMDNEGFIWFSDNSYNISKVPNYIGKIDPLSLNTTYYPLPTLGAEALDLYIDDDYIWFSEWQNNQIGRLDKLTGEIIEIPIPCPSGRCAQIGVEMDDNSNLWFVDYLANNIGKLNATSLDIKLFELPPPPFAVAPSKLLIDNQGLIWTGFHGGDHIISFNPKTEEISSYYTRKPVEGYGISGITDLIFDKDNNIWFSQHLENNIGLFLRNSQTMMEFNLFRNQTAHQWLSIDQNGSIWYAEHINDLIGRIKPNQTPKIDIYLDEKIYDVNKGNNLEIAFDVIPQSDKFKDFRYQIFGQINNFYETDSKLKIDKTYYNLSRNNRHMISLEVPIMDQASNQTIIVGIQTNEFYATTTVFVKLTQNYLLIFLQGGLFIIILVILILMARRFKIPLNRNNNS